MVHLKICGITALVLFAGGLSLSHGLKGWPKSVQADESQAASEAKSLRAFAAVASVLTSPRCLNCHMIGDSPLQGDQGTPHNMNVKRGPDGRGTPAMRCRNCHQDENSSTPHAPPGAADWRLPPPATPMVWQGLSTGDLCRTLKDPGKNGERSVSQLPEHFREERLVRWSWNPGPGRSVPPLSHEEFLAKVDEWIQNGAVCAP